MDWKRFGKWRTEADLNPVDVGLPKLHGIEAARRIHKFVPDSKRRGARSARLRRGGYVVKTMAEGDLLTGVENGLSAALKQAAIFSARLIRAQSAASTRCLDQCYLVQKTPL